MQKREGIWRYKDGEGMTVCRGERDMTVCRGGGIWRYQDGGGMTVCRGEREMAVKRWRGELAGTWHDDEEENQTRRLGIFKTMTLAD